MKLFVAAALAGLTACSAAQRIRPAWPDAPLQMRDDTDRDQAIDQLWVLEPGAQRDAIRNQIASAIARRIGDALEEDKPFVTETLLFDLTALWRTDPALIGVGLAPHAALLHRLRTTFAKSGAIEPTIATLVVLAEVEPAHRAEHLDEIQEVLGFADELAAAEDGAEAQRAQPIELLQPTVLALPMPWLVDLYVKLLEDRQRAIVAFITKHGASIELVRAHRNIVSTARRIAITLARAGRTDEIFAHVGKIEGLGGDREVALRAEVVAEQPTADAYVELSRVLRSDDHDHVADETAALAVCLAGLKRFPTDYALLVAAAEDAASLGRLDQPLELYEAAVRVTGAKAGDLDGAVALRLGKLYAERIARLAFGGRPTAANDAWRELSRYADGHRGDVWIQVAASGETALGRGLLSQGQLADAEHALVASLDRAPSIDAYETLATIYYKTGRLGSATKYATAGLALLGNTTGDHYRRAKLERLAGDVTRAAGKARDAAALYLDAMRVWASLGTDKDLPRAIAGERKLEAGRAMWFLGDAAQATNLVLAAVDVDSDSASTCSSAVAFLLEVDRPIDAVDALRTGLGSSNITELYKVYMSLWVVADARRRGEPPDRQAWDYLAGRHGDLWYEQLAEAATGRLDFAALRAAASSGPRLAELAFYGVVLGLDPDARSPQTARVLLQKVVDARLVMDAEFDLAQQYLARLR